MEGVAQRILETLTTCFGELEDPRVRASCDHRLIDILAIAILGVTCGAAAEELETLRRHANALALNAAQAWLSASKGAGFLASHPASRAIREAQFFQVWSCPQNVLAAALQVFSCAGE